MHEHEPAFISAARTFWLRQAQKPMRQGLLIWSAVLLSFVVIGVPVAPHGLQSLLSGLILLGALGLDLGWFTSIRRSRGIDTPPGRWFRIARTVGTGVIAMIAVPMLMNGAVASSNPIVAVLGVIAILVVLVLILGCMVGVIIWQLTHSPGLSKIGTYGASVAHTAPVESAVSGESVPAEDVSLLALLNDPDKLNWHLLHAGLAQKLGQVGQPAPRRNGDRYDGARAGYVAVMNMRARRRRVPGQYIFGNERYRVPQVVRVKPTKSGPIAWLNILPGTTPAAYEKSAETMANSIGIRGGITIVQTDQDRVDGVVQLMFRLHNPLNNVIAYDFNLPVTYRSVPFGVQENGELLCLGGLESNLLFGGTPGGGKSGGLTAYLAGISRLPNTAIIGLDPKRVEQGMWKSRFSRIAKTGEDALDVLQRLNEEMDRRYEWLDVNKRKKVTEDLLELMPWLVLVPDELADLVANGITKDEKAADGNRMSLMRRLVSLGRAAGITVVPATQKPQSDVIPTSFRDLIQQRAAYATTNAAMTDTILGAGMSSNGGLSHTIAGLEKGVCYVVNESSRTPIKARTFWIPDDDVEAIAERTAHLRVQLDWLDAESDEDLDGDLSPASSNKRPSRLRDEYRDLA